MCRCGPSAQVTAVPVSVKDSVGGCFGWLLVKLSGRLVSSSTASSKLLPPLDRTLPTWTYLVTSSLTMNVMTMTLTLTKTNDK